MKESAARWVLMGIPSYSKRDIDGTILGVYSNWKKLEEGARVATSVHGWKLLTVLSINQNGTIGDKICDERHLTPWFAGGKVPL